MHFLRSLPAAAARLILVLIVAVLTTGTGLAFGGTAASADDIDAISGGPSDGVIEDGRTRFSYQMEPGQVIDDYYMIKNTGTTAQVLTVFGTDAYNADDGGYALLDTADAPVDAGSWITFEGNVRKLQIPLGPGESRTVSFTVTVPDNAGPGDHPAGIVISVASGSGQVLVDKRFATRLYVRVPGELQPLLTVTSISGAYNPQWNPFTGTTTITATFKNAGNVALGADAIVGVNTFFGIPVGSPGTDEVTELLPGSTRTVSFTVEGIGQLGYLDAYVKAQPTVDDAALNPGVLTPTSRDTVVWAIPWWLVIVIAIALLVWVFLRIRRVRDERAAVAWIAYTEEQARLKAGEAPVLEAAGAVGETDRPQ
ncbi:MAG: hypothetical protein LCH43_02250 [Actinobacteria bacterium]|nr:hypothetical protein [Actinomycetota bacterium]